MDVRCRDGILKSRRKHDYVAKEEDDEKAVLVVRIKLLVQTLPNRCKVRSCLLNYRSESCNGVAH